MTNLEYVLNRVSAGARVRFREDFYGGVYVVCYPSFSWYPRLLLRLKRGRKLSSAEVATVKEAIRKQRQSG